MGRAEVSSPSPGRPIVFGDMPSRLAGYWAFFAYTVTHLRVLRIAPVRKVFHRQIYFTGIEGVYLVGLLGLLAGALAVTQTTALVGGNSELTVRMLVWAVVDELGPLLAAIIIVARSAVAIATELALMEARAETEDLARLRVNIMDYLVVPRMTALTLSAVVLTIYFQSVAVAGGLAVSALYQSVSFWIQLTRFFDVVTLADVFVALLKSFCFGAAVASISCYHGLAVGRSLTAVPLAAMRAVIHSLLFVFVIDVLFAYARYIL
jgi:phospholipid/cholesterol/gamma-HCH transport system permease protein